MAKIKVHEIAKELDKQSKEIIAFLQGKGIEVKAAQSSLEEDVADMVRKAMGGAKAVREAVTEKKEEAKPEVRAEGKMETKAQAKEMKAEEKPKAAENVPKESKEKPGKAPENRDAKSPEGGEKPKKKKKIIFVSNPHNSNMTQRPSQGEKRLSQGEKRPGQTGARPGQGNNNRQGSRANEGNNGGRNARNNRNAGANKQGTFRQEAQHKIIRPLTAPSVPESMQVDFKQNARRLENERLARNAQALKAQSTEEKAAENSGNVNAQASENNNQRTGSNGGGAAGGRGNAAQAFGSGTQTGYAAGQERGRQPAAGRDGAASRPAQREERRQRNERTQGNERGAGSGQGERNQRNDSRRFDGSNRQGGQAGRGDFRGNGSERNNNRPGSNNNRPERGDKGQDGRFKRGEKQGKGFDTQAPVKDEKRRDDEKRRIGQEKDKKSRKDFIYEEDDAAVKNKNKAGRFIKPEKKPEEAVEEQIKVITIPDTLTIKELADKMKLQPSVIIKKLFLKGQIMTVNSEITFEDAENIAIEYEIICEKEEKVDVIEELLKEDEEEEGKLKSRPPVICVMGHVDHGKTSLLDAIRKTNVTDKEAGGITQHIGAYTVTVNDQSITFLDTPGHEAFTAMRMRGANSTDIAILVVAADDGVMPQTVEAINHAKAAGTEIIVAVNKIDKPGANIDRVKQEMTEYELIPVDWGGTTEFVPVSAKTGEGLDALLETILLTAEILELKANPSRRARGLVIEAELDKGRGPVATVLVQKGTLHVGDFISAGASHGKVRAMIDDKGRRVKEAYPSTPVEILGLSDVPSAGEVFIAHENDKTAKSYAETYLAQNKERMLEDTKAKMSLDDLFNQIQAGNLKELNIIVKADVQGSVEAVKQSLMKLSNEEVVVKCIHGGVGAINESDVSLASASSAIIIGFNVRPDNMAKTIAEREGVDIRLYRVIYQAIEDIEAAMKGMLDPVFEEKVIGHAEVRQIFKASAVGNIAGSYVLDGTLQRDCKVRITRAGVEENGGVIYEGALASLKRFKDDVKEVRAGFECGLVFDGFDQMQELDIVEAYIMVEVPR
ncbi:MAG: translation initiation factor IF-2 [Lachnospiraceae bacterium]|jgi:translation initiation factor IF-2|nr:translation initiation factor IF-2 [Lachnospiraceae bacterium]MCI9202914.1 translation initiation factor IF-2 [Lachnospiraceae bacterium]